MRVAGAGERNDSEAGKGSRCGCVPGGENASPDVIRDRNLRPAATVLPSRMGGVAVTPPPGRTSSGIRKSMGLAGRAGHWCSQVGLGLLLRVLLARELEGDDGIEARLAERAVGDHGDGDEDGKDGEDLEEVAEPLRNKTSVARCVCGEFTERENFLYHPKYPHSSYL